MHEANNTHRRAAEQHELAAHAHRISAEHNIHNIMIKGITKLEIGMRNEQWSTPIRRTNWQWNPIASRVRS